MTEREKLEYEKQMVSAEIDMLGIKISAHKRLMEEYEEKLEAMQWTLSQILKELNKPEEVRIPKARR